LVSPFSLSFFRKNAFDYLKIFKNSGILPNSPDGVKKTTKSTFYIRFGEQFFIFSPIDYCLSEAGIWIILVWQDL